MPLVIPHTFVAGATVDPVQVNENFAAGANVINGGLTAANLSPAAGVLPTQLSGAYEHMTMNLAVYSGFSGAVGTRVDYKHIPGTTADTDGNWVITEIDWLCDDTGDGNGQFQIIWGGHTGQPTAWNTVSTVMTVTITRGVDAGGSPLNESPNNVAITGLAVTLVRQTYPCCLALMPTVAGVGVVSGVTPFDRLLVSFKMRRYISAT